MIKARNWSGKDLKGEWTVTIKIDGVRALWNDKLQRWESRNGKPLYNIPTCNVDVAKDVEVFCGSFKETIEKTRASTKDRPVDPKHLFSLDPLDKRLRGPRLINPTADAIKTLMRATIVDGNEGLVLRQGDTWLKVKPTYTYDVEVTGIIEGTGKHKGRMGALVTPMGKVGTGFSDAERYDFWFRYCMINEHAAVGLRPTPELAPVIGSTIEVECMHLTVDGKFRHPRFVRSRPDK